MPDTRTVEVKFDAKIAIRNNGDVWTAYIEPTGMTLHGKTEEEAVEKAEEAVRTFIRTICRHDGVAAVRKYLDYHETLHSIVEAPPAATPSHDKIIPRRELDVKLEVA